MPSTVRAPRAWALIDGTPLPLQELDVNLNLHQASDTASATLALSALPPGYDLAYFAAQPQIPLAVRVSDGSTLKQLFSGTCDQAEIDFAQGTVRLNARDNSGKLLDKKTTEKFPNKTASEIAKEVAQRHGLKVQVDDTKTKVGAYYEEYSRLTDRDAEWHLLSKLAEREGFVCYVRDGTLYFKRGDDTTLPVFDVWYVPPTPESYAGGNWTGLRVVRNLTLTKPVKVTVRSWNSKEKRGVVSEKELGGEGDDPLLYEYRSPGLTQEQADNIAAQRLSENTKHEIAIELDAPGDLSIDPRMMLKLSGTRSVLDQRFFISSVQHRISQEEGFRMTVSAKNKSEKRK